MDLTYIPMRRGFLYLVAVLDWATRRVLAWRLSNSAGGRRSAWTAWRDALRGHGRPEIFNTDQGSQFTSHGLHRGASAARGLPSASGWARTGAWRDNLFVERLWKSVKYEEVYLHAYDSGREAPGARSVLHLLQRGPASHRAGRPDPGYGLLRHAASAEGCVI